MIYLLMGVTVLFLYLSKNEYRNPDSGMYWSVLSIISVIVLLIAGISSLVYTLKYEQELNPTNEFKTVIEDRQYKFKEKKIFQKYESDLDFFLWTRDTKWVEVDITEDMI